MRSWLLPANPPATPTRPPAPQLRASLGLQSFTSQLAAPAGQGGLLVPPLEVTHFLVADTADFVAVQFNTQGEQGRGSVYHRPP